MTWLLLIIQYHLNVSFHFIQVLSITDLIVSRRLATDALRRCDQQQQQPPSRHADLSYIKVMILLDLLWICFYNLLHNKSTTNLQQIDKHNLLLFIQPNANQQATSGAAGRIRC